MDNVSLNRVELRGRIGQDPKIAQVGNTYVTHFSLATSEIYKDRNGDLREETTWHNITAWAGRSIEDFQNLRKGVLVSVVGRLRSVKYTNAEGEGHQYMEVLASRLSVVQEADRNQQ